MSANMKALLIILAILLVIAGLVYLLLYGIGGRQSLVNVLPLPSNHAAETYVLDNKLLSQVSSVNTIDAGGPVFTAVIGTDGAGDSKTVWLTGKDNQITVRGSAVMKEGLSKTDIYNKLLLKKITRDQVDALFTSPYDYTSGKIIWFVQIHDIRNHWITYDFKTGAVISDVYQDPTAFKL